MTHFYFHRNHERSGWPKDWCTVREKKTARSDELGVGGVGSGSQRRKSMKTGRQWWTVNRPERICRATNWQSPPLSSNIMEIQPAKMWLSVSCKKASAVSCCDLVTRTLFQMQKRQKYNLKVGEQKLMPFGGKCDNVSASGLWEQDRTACRSMWNTIVLRQLQVSKFYSTKIGLCCRPL